MEGIREIVGRIKAEKQRQGLTQAELERRGGLKPKSLWELLNRDTKRPGLLLLAGAARGLGKSIEWVTEGATNAKTAGLLAERGDRYNEVPARKQPPADKGVPEEVDPEILLGWLAERLQALYDAQGISTTLAELVTAAAQMHGDLVEPASPEAYRKAAERALERRRLWLQKHRAAILSGRAIGID